MARNPTARPPWPREARRRRLPPRGPLPASRLVALYCNLAAGRADSQKQTTATDIASSCATAIARARHIKLS
eukprot:14209233-Heterocapsa_arctica.AAC.1